VIDSLVVNSACASSKAQKFTNLFIDEQLFQIYIWVSAAVLRQSEIVAAVVPETGALIRPGRRAYRDATSIGNPAYRQVGVGGA
jgi:hypothetical protein